ESILSLAFGSRLGHFEILGLLGAGGMGEVYNARDTRLGRIVAIKVLPSHLSENPDLQAHPSPHLYPPRHRPRRRRRLSRHGMSRTFGRAWVSSSLLAEAAPDASH